MFGLGLMVGALAGLGFAAWVNQDWYKHSMKITDSWYNFTKSVIEELGREDGDGDG